MKSRKVKAAARSKAYMKKLKSTIPLDDERNSFDEQENDSSDGDDDLMQNNSSSSEEEILPITDDESEEDVKDEEDSAVEDDLPNLDNWGTKKSTYYNADFVDKDRGKTYREKDLELENAEREAAYLQQQTAAELDRYESTAYFEDYERGINLLSKGPPTDALESEIDDDSPEAEKIKHEKRKYPQFQEYKEKFIEKVDELNNKLGPLVELMEKLNLNENFMYYIKLKYQILLHYLLNISFYLYLKNSEDIPENHPIYERINQFKELDDKMNAHKNYLKEIDVVLEKLNRNEDLSNKVSRDAKKSSAPKIKRKKSKSIKDENMDKLMKNKFKQIETEDEKQIYDLYVNMKDQRKKHTQETDNIEMNENQSKEDENENCLDENSGEKRTITYQIAKNKGLIAKKKKEYRNPRVHHRMKFKKAKIRRKGQVRGVIKEIKRYAGEPTGISTHVVKSVKF